MLLTHGNIKKSKVLKYCFQDEANADRRAEADRAYRERLESAEYAAYQSVAAKLHDAAAKLGRDGENIVIDLKPGDDGEESFRLVFTSARIIGWNKVLKSGHIARLNRRAEAWTYLYDEIYIDNGNNYITIALAPRSQAAPLRSGVYFPLATIRFRAILTTAVPAVPSSR